MGARRRGSQKQQCAAKAEDAKAIEMLTETIKALPSKVQSELATKEKSTKGASRRSCQRQQQRAAKDASSADTSAKVPRDSSKNDATKLVPSLEEVMAAIESLYVDELKPFGRILRKRVAEQAMVASGVLNYKEENLSDVDVKQLHTLCDGCDALLVEPEEGGDWSVTIVDRPDAFVDVYSSVDMYPGGMWGAAAAYFQLLSGDNMYLPGGRYSCAQELRARSLAFLEGRSLGQVCHIVQLAISQKKVLGYLNGAVVPYASSQSMLKEQCAQSNTACSAARASTEGGAGAAENSLTMATWETAREFLREILSESAKSSDDHVGTVPLSNVKRLFRSRFQTELSETKLGHSKLTQLLQDKRFSDICSVELQGHGYIVKQAEAPANHTICLQDALGAATGAKANWPLVDGYFGSLVQRTFIHASLPPPTPPPNARRRSASLPRNTGSGKGSLQVECLSFSVDQATETESTLDSARSSDGAELSQSFAASGSSRPPSVDGPIKVMLRECNGGTSLEPVKVEESSGAVDTTDVQPRRRLEFCPDEPLALDEADIFLESAPITQTPYTPTIPKWSYHVPSPLTKSGSVVAEQGFDSESSRRLQFCPDEPLAMDDAGIFLDSLPTVPSTPFTPQSVPRWPCLAPLAFEEADVFIDSVPAARTPTNMRMQQSASRWPCLSPSSLVRDARVGSVSLSKVHNTFIHSPLAPPTPLRVGASRRSASVPKTFGSDKNAWEAMCQALGCNQIPQNAQECRPNAGDCAHTPSVYVDYVVPPSPDFPTYCNAHQLSQASFPQSVMLASGQMMHGYVWPVCSHDLPNVIRLADFLQ